MGSESRTWLVKVRATLRYSVRVIAILGYWVRVGASVTVFVRFRRIFVAVSVPKVGVAVVAVRGLRSWRHKSGMRRGLLTGGCGRGSGDRG